MKSGDWKTAWEQCYAYFGCCPDEYVPEQAALRLAFYLANFGMFRASGRLRELQLEDFDRIATVTFNFRDLRDRKPKFLAKNQDRVQDLISAIEEALDQKGVAPTDCLVTKIILGTVACLPAYDRFAVKALRHNGLIGKPSTRGLAQLFSLRSRDLPKFGAHEDATQPFMRNLDLGLLETGRLLSAKYKD